MRVVPPEELLEIYKRLPDQVRSYLVSTELGDTVTAIGKKNGLHVDIVGKLSECITQMLLGLIPPTELMSEMHDLAIPTDKAMLIARELNEQIFKPLNQKMREGRGEPPRVPDPPQVGVPKPLGESLPTPPPAPEPPPVMDATPVVPAVPPQTSNTTPSPIEPLPVFRPSAPPMPVPQPMRPATMPGQAQAAPKSYASDPYREPIDPADK